MDAEYRMSFQLMDASVPEPAGLLKDLDGVASVSSAEGRIVVTGRGDFVTGVTTVLARERVLVTDLRIDQRTLDDAFVALTGRSLQP